MGLNVVKELFTPDPQTTLEGLRAEIQSRGLVPLPISWFYRSVQGNEWLDVENVGVEEFLDATKVLAANVVLIALRSITQEDFVFDWDGDEPRRLLSDVIPQLHEFAPFVDRPCEIDLLVPTSSCRLRYNLQVSWLPELEDLLAAADDILREEDRENRKEERAKLEAERNVKAERSLTSLADNREFNRLPSQKAMLAWVRLHIPDLADVPDQNVITHIQMVRAKAQARRTQPMLGEHDLFDHS